MKKLISIALIMCMTVGLLSGCVFNSTSVSEDIINIQTAGYLYTPSSKAGSKDERTFLKEREKSIDTMISFIEKGAKNAYVVNDGLEKYEDNLLDYIDKINDPDTLELSIIGGIAQKIASYKVITASYEDEIRQYLEMKPKDDASTAIINSYMSDVFYKLVKLQSEYIEWLMNNTASVSAILEKTSERLSEKLISSSESLYSKKIQSAFSQLLGNYESASFINSAILSADYYTSEIYLTETLENIESSKSGQSVTDLKEMYDTAVAARKKPSILKPVPAIETSFSFTRRVNAESNNLEFISFIGFLEYYTTVGLPPLDTSSQPNVNEENFSEKVEAKKETIIKAPEKMAENIEKKPEGIHTPSKDAKSAKEIAAENAAIRSERITLISAGQYVIKGINVINTNAAYIIAINKISDLVAGGKTMSEEEKQSAIALIKTNMNEIIGSDKVAFVNLIVNTNAEEIYGTFENWRDNIGNLEGYVFTKDDLITLLEKMGMDVKKPDTVVVQVPDTSPSPGPLNTTPPDVSATFAPIPSQTAAPTTQPIDETEPEDNYGVAEISILWQSLKEFNRYIGNTEAMYMIFGWTDLLDYSQYEKKEIKNDDGNVIRTQYLLNSYDKVGWEESIYDGSIEYTYRFPDSNDAGISIYRAGTPEKSYISMIKTFNKLTDRKVDLRFNDPEDSDKKEVIKSVSQYQSDTKDGLNYSNYNSNPYFVLYDMGEILESYVYKDGILIREVINTQREGKMESHIIEYYDSGKIKRDFTEWDGDKDGTYTSYYESGIVSRYAEYLDDKFHGVYINYYENSNVYEYFTYLNGVLDGPGKKYQSADPHILSYECDYTAGEKNGLMKGYSPEGFLRSEVEFVMGVRHGIYRDYRVGTQLFTNSYHMFGQYENGKKTGQWELGEDNVTPIELVFYENDVKIWTQYTDTNIRNYYDSAGTVIRTEDMN